MSRYMHSAWLWLMLVLEGMQGLLGGHVRVSHFRAPGTWYLPLGFLMRKDGFKYLGMCIFPAMLKTMVDCGHS